MTDRSTQTDKNAEQEGKPTQDEEKKVIIKGECTNSSHDECFEKVTGSTDRWVRSLALTYRTVFVRFLPRFQNLAMHVKRRRSCIDVKIATNPSAASVQ
jgi:hypothetical protein